MAYWYLDKYQILHGSKSVDTAIKFSGNNKAIDKDIPVRGGYPFLDGVELVMESADKIYVEGNSKIDKDGKVQGKAVDSSQYPALKSLYAELLKG